MPDQIKNQRRSTSRSIIFPKVTSRWPSRDRWSVILAGGDGSRLLSLTRTLSGDDRPKQFCRILGNKTLLDQTRCRIALTVPADQTLFSLTETHRQFFATLGDIAPENLVVQPTNLGTTPAILYSLLRLSARDPRAAVAFFPSDHHFSDDQTFMSHVDSAFEAVSVRPDLIVLLGIEADRPEVEYGWIEPAPVSQLPKAIRQVQRFWEKPSVNTATSLMDRGCLWNSFVMVGRVDRFLKMIKRAVPELFEAFEAIRPLLMTDREACGIRTLYSKTKPSNFSQEVLSKRTDDLSVLLVKDVLWSDLGDPSRVSSTLAGIGFQTEWGKRQPVSHEFNT